MSTKTVTIECDTGNGYENSNIGVRISSIFVILLGSMGGALLPFAIYKTKHFNVSPWIFSVMKYFGSGVIIATAFIHLLAPAAESLGSPCLSGPITNYSWAEGIVLLTVFIMFFIELLALRFDVFGYETHDLESKAPSVNISCKWKERSEELNFPESHKSSPEFLSQMGNQGSSAPKNVASSTHLGNDAETQHNFSDLNTSPPDTSVQIQTTGDDRQYDADDDYDDVDDAHDVHFTAQLTAMFVLEFGVIFHSIFIGLTLAVTSNDKFNILYTVLVFHQTFEGLGLGSRLASITWPKDKTWVPWALGIAFGLTTPVAIAIGIVVHKSFKPESQSTMIINGVFDAISAGILIYTGLVDLMAHEFMFNKEMRNASFNTVSFACLTMCCGAALMALLGKWA